MAAHDLRRTCAKLCRKSGGDPEQIKFLLGHSSIQTTERYLGYKQDIEIAVNDNLGLQRRTSTPHGILGHHNSLSGYDKTPIVDAAGAPGKQGDKFPRTRLCYCVMFWVRQSSELNGNVS